MIGSLEFNLPTIRINRTPLSPSTIKPSMEKSAVPIGVRTADSSVEVVSSNSNNDFVMIVDNTAKQRAHKDLERHSDPGIELRTSTTPSPELLRGLSTPEPEDSPPLRSTDSDELLRPSVRKTVENSLLLSPYFGTPKKHDSPITGENSPFYSNPMESEVDGESVAACRGDCIGNTTYSERQVIKILMKWMKEFEPEQSSHEDCVDSGQASELGASALGANVSKKLNSDLDEELSLLWDLSSEADVINYLVEKNVYTIIKDTLAVSTCSRLKEIALGIFSNILSFRNILDTFPSTDVELGLISMITLEIQVASDVALLVQAFSVLERVVWYINEVNVNKSWIICMLNLEFVNAVNFLLESSTNALLLGKILLTILPLFETLSRVNVFETEDCEPEEMDFETRMAQNYDVFCETAHVSSLYEGLMELVKSTPENDQELDVAQIPPDHVQTAICSGLACYCYLQKFKSGQNALTKDSGQVVNFLRKFYEKFNLYTTNLDIEKAFEYFASGLNLLSFCHRVSLELDSNTLLAPIQAAIIFIEREELKKSDASDLLNSIGVVIHEHLVEVGDKFGQKEVYSCVENENEKFKSFLKFVEEALKYFESKVLPPGAPAEIDTELKSKKKD